MTHYTRPERHRDWIEKKETWILSVLARMRSTSDAATKRNAYVLRLREKYDLPELVRSKLSAQAT